MSIIISNGTVVSDNEIKQVDIGIKDDKIVAIEKNLESSEYSTVIDATGKYIFPGFIDPHVHIKLPMRGTFSQDDFYSATRAAAAGGVTSIIDFATQMGDQSLENAIEERHREARDKVVIDYALHGGITEWDRVKSELNMIIQHGVSSFKMFMAYKERGLYSSDEDIVAAIRATKDLGAMIMLHAESEELLTPLLQRYGSEEMKKKHGVLAHVYSRPPQTEFRAIENAVGMLEEAQGNLYIVHISTRKGAEWIRVGRDKGLNIIGETCPQYLMFNEDVFSQQNGHYFATAPQIKSEDDRKGLWKAIQKGDLQIIGTDSVAFTKEQKDSWNNDFMEIPLGVSGTELMAPLLYTKGVLEKKLSLTDFVNFLSTHAAKVFGMYPKKGTIQVGSDADIVIFDPQKKKTIHHADLYTPIDWSAYEGWELQGFADTVILRGTIIYMNDKVLAPAGYGEYIRRGASGNYL
ncbi:MAG: dihydropyrimidinase [Candidatus Heimdallarchaeota archaeon]|nr:dihydropyrimidinase [Candidatus Heimdallarchaeota archaeon]